MTDCNEAIRPVHNRMPVLLQTDDYEQWLHGSLDDAVSLQDRCFSDELITMERTSDLWINRSVPA
jgi:putative SOS response-associated peptidase YedK